MCSKNAIVAAAAINFSPTRVRLLIEGGSYLRAAFVYFRPIPHGTIDINSGIKDWFLRIVLQMMILLKGTLPRYLRTKPSLSSATFLP